MVDGVVDLAFHDWKDFKANFVDKLRAVQVSAWPDAAGNWDEKRFLYRGQACGDWRLISSFDRWMKKQPDSRPIDDRVEDRYWTLLAGFIKGGLEMRLFPPEFSDLPQSPEELRRFDKKSAEQHNLVMRAQSFGQHRGLATRLLDWSHSPYVAAFFAFSQWRKCETGLVAVWCLDVSETKRLFKEGDIQVIDAIGQDDQRQLWQRGSSTQNNSNMLELNQLFEERSNRFKAELLYPALLKCTIPCEDHRLALRDLNMMRINHLSVFPDHEGLVRETEYSLEVKERLEVSKHS